MKAKLKILPILITASRFFLTFLFIFLQYKEYYKNLLIVFAIICITDIFDGKIARFLKAESNLGGFLDLTADAFFIFSSLVILNILKIMPYWFTIFVFFKFIEFIITSSIWKRFNGRSNEYYMKDTPGRLAAAMFYMTPEIVYMLLYYRFKDPQMILISYMCITTALSLCSSFMRCTKVLYALKRDIP